MRTLVIDDAPPAGLAAELSARGREARAAPPALDSEVVEAAAGAVLVTVFDLPAPTGGAVAVVAARGAAARRDVVHRHAHEMSAQRPGSVRRYR